MSDTTPRDLRVSLVPGTDGCRTCDALRARAEAAERRAAGAEQDRFDVAVALDSCHQELKAVQARERQHQAVNSELAGAVLRHEQRIAELEARLREAEAANEQLAKKCRMGEMLVAGARESSRMDRQLIAQAQRERDEARKQLAEEVADNQVLLAQAAGYREAACAREAERDEARSVIADLLLGLGHDSRGRAQAFLDGVVREREAKP